METIRFNYSSISAGIIVKSAFSYDFEHYIVAPAEFAGVALFPVILMDKKSLKKYFLLLELVCFFFLHIFVTGARSFIFDIVLVLLVFFLMNGNLRRRFREYFKRIPKVVFIIVGIGATGLFILMTQMRRGFGSSIVHEVYSYFSISFRLLDIHLNIMDINPEYTFGMTLFHGLLRPFFLVLKAIGIPYPEIYSKTVNLIDANNIFYPVGNGSANSFVTVFYYFYMDFGYLGVILGCTIYGYIAQSLYNNLIKNPVKRNQAIYLLFAVGLLLSFMRLHFTAYGYVYAFVILLFCFSNKKKKTATIIRESLHLDLG